MEVYKVNQNIWLRTAAKYLKEGLHRNAYLVVESPVVGVYRKTQVDEKICNALGYEVVETFNNGSTVVHSKGDILFGHFAEVENDWYNRFVDYFVNWLRAKGLNADFVSNDIVVDGYKICGMATTRYGRIDYTGGFISMNVNLDHIKAICKKPILYINPDKKRTDSWLSLNRLQLPLGEKRYGPIRKIAYVDGKVKVQSPKNMSEIQKKLFDAGIVDEFGNKLFSDRDTESVSNRSLLANAFESIAQNDAEKRKIQEYKAKIEQINSEEKKLRDLNSEIKQLSFGKGKRDDAKIRQLREEATKTANRISTYDKQLLRLEASKPLQAVLAREKKMAYQKAEKKGKDALAEYKKNTEKKQRELVKHYQEARKKGVESRERTAMRHKIQNVVGELNQYLLKGTKERHIPIELQKAVAEALDAVNMDTVGAEERIAKLKADLLKAKTPEQIQEISRKIDRVQSMGDRMDSRLKALKESYDQFIHSDDPLIANSYDDVISAKLESVIENVGDTSLRDMSISQLEEVYDMYRMVLTTIRNANKTFKAARNATVAELGESVMQEVHAIGGKKQYSTKMLDSVKKFGWNNLKPVYAFEVIGSKTFSDIFSNVRSGEDTWAADITEAREYYLEKAKKYNYDSWKMDKWYDFESTSGMDFSLNLEQIMSLYAFSKREQAADHLRRGGIVIDESTEITMKTKFGFNVKFNPTEATAYNISDETLSEIISKLTPEQKGFVDEMQDYLSTVMGNKGNEVSLEMYGVKLFKEKFYFPLKSASQFMAKAKEQQQGEVKIKNSGFSKDTVKKASNPIVLTPFMNVWANHVNEMSMYHAFVLPMEDGFYGFSQDHMTKHGVFANSLTDTQRNAIYETGRNARAQQVAFTTPQKGTVGKNATVGRVHFEGNRESLTDIQRTSMTALEKIADVMGVQIHIFESEVGENEKRIGANGWYDPKDNSIHIDLHAGANGEGTMLFTASHELTHHIRKWSPEKFKTLSDFLMQEYGKKDVNVDGLVREQMAKAERSNRHLTYDEAFEEVVADSMEQMLSDGNVIKRLEKLKAQDKDLWHRIKSFLDDLADKIRSVYKGMKPDSVEGRYVADMGKTIYRLQELFTEGLVDATENYQADSNQNKENEKESVQRSDFESEVKISEEQVAQADRNLEAEVKYSVREMFFKEFDAWDKKDPNVRFVTGATSDVLKSVGMKDQDIILRSGTVLQKIKTHPEMNLDIFTKIPELLEHPVIVQFSDAIDPKTKRPKYDSSITVLGELYADVKEGTETVKKPVLVSLELLPTNQKKTAVLDFAIIKSAYSKNALQQYINENSMEKVPKGLSEYGITTEEVEKMFLAFCKEQSKEE